MSLKDYEVKRDEFVEDEPDHGGFCFPCCACKYQDEEDTGPHCSVCDHNENAIPERVKK